jgi:hypothetical protein
MNSHSRYIVVAVLFIFVPEPISLLFLLPECPAVNANFQRGRPGVIACIRVPPASHKFGRSGRRRSPAAKSGFIAKISTYIISSVLFLSLREAAPTFLSTATHDSAIEYNPTSSRKVLPTRDYSEKHKPTKLTVLAWSSTL